MVGELGAATVKIDLDSSKFSSGLNKAKGDFNSAAGDMEGRASNLGSKIGGALVTGVTALTVSLAALGTVGVKTFMDIEAASADAASKMDIGKIAADQGITAEAAFTGVKEKVMALSDELGQLNTNAFDPTKISQALAAMAAGGFDVANASAKDFSGILAMATGTNYDLTRSAELAMSTMNQFGLKTEDLGRITDVYTMAAGKSAASMTDFDYAMQQAGPVAKGVGMSYEELTARISKLADAGYGGEKSGTALRTAMLKLTSTTQPQMDALTRLGLTYQQVDPRVHSFSETLDLLASKGASIYELGEIFGVEGAAVVKTTMDQQAGVKQLTMELENSTGAAENMAKMMLDTLSGSFDAAMGAASSLVYMIGGQLAPTLKAAFEWFSSTGAPAIREFIQAIVDGDWGKIADIIKSAFDKATDIIVDWAKRAGEAIINAPWGTYAQKAGSLLVDALKSVISTSAKIWEWIGEALQGWIDSGGPRELGRRIGELIIDGLKAVWELATDLWDALKKTFGGSRNWLDMGIAIAKGIGGGLLDAFHPYIAKFYNYFVDKGRELVIWGTTTGVGIANSFIEGFNWVLGGMQSIADSIYSVYEKLVGKLTTMLQAVGKAANETIQWVNKELGTSFATFDLGMGSAGGASAGVYYKTNKYYEPEFAAAGQKTDMSEYTKVTADLLKSNEKLRVAYEKYIIANPSAAIGSKVGFFDSMKASTYDLNEAIKGTTAAYDSVFKKMDEGAVYFKETTEDAADEAATTTKDAAVAAADTTKMSAEQAAEIERRAAETFREQIYAASDKLASDYKAGTEAVKIGLTDAGQKIAVIGTVAQQNFMNAGGKWVSDSAVAGSALITAGVNAGSALLSGASSASSALASLASSVSSALANIGNRPVGTPTNNISFQQSGFYSGGVSGFNVGSPSDTTPSWMRGNKVFGYATGKETNGPELALIGEAGKEFVIPANGKRKDLLYKAMAAYGIPAMAEGGEAGASETAAAPAGMTATFGIAGLAAMSKDVQKKLNSLKDFFRITWGIVKSEAQVNWNQINKLIVEAATGIRDKVWTQLIAMRNDALNEGRQMVTQLGEVSKTIWPAFEPGVTSFVTNTVNAVTGMAVIMNATLNASLTTMITSVKSFKTEWDKIWATVNTSLVDTQKKMEAAIKVIQAQLATLGISMNIVSGGSGGSGGYSGGMGGSEGGSSTGNGSTVNVGSGADVNGNFTDMTCTGDTVLVNGLKYTNPQGVTNYINPFNYISGGGISGYQGSTSNIGGNKGTTGTASNGLTYVGGSGGGSGSGGSSWKINPNSGLFGWGSSKLFGPTKSTGSSSSSGGATGGSIGGGYSLPPVFRAKGALEDEGARRVIVGEAGPELIIPTKYTNLLTAMADEFAGQGAIGGSGSTQATIVVENNHYWNGRKMVDLVMTESKRRIEQKGVRASK